MPEHALPPRRLARRLWRGPFRVAGLTGLATALASTGCHQPGQTGFSPDRASGHVRMLAGTIGSRPTGTDANRRARDYVAAELRGAGFEVRLQEATAARPSMATPVVNILATRPGRQAEAIALVSHYDSVPESPGAADDALGVAVCIEAGRALASRPNPRYSLLVAVTDGEELGLMGASVLTSAPEFAGVRTFINFEAVGTGGPPRVFQAGPGNSWLASAWAASAHSPAGSSLFAEIYRRLPNDTDFSELKGLDRPGLDVAPTGNTFAYHTKLDTPARLDPATIEQAGDNAVRLAIALDGLDITTPSIGDATFFDVAGVTAFAYAAGPTRALAFLALAAGVLAVYKAFRIARREIGLLRLVVTVVWTIAGIAAAAGAMCLGCWLLRAGTGLQHPWYAKPGLLIVFLTIVGSSAAWLTVMAGRSLPPAISPSGTPACVWMLALPLWVALAALAQRLSPVAGYLFTLPLLPTAILVLALPIGRVAVGRGVSAVAALVAGLLWLPLVWPLVEFLVGQLGRLPVTAPVWVCPVVALSLATMIAPPVAGLLLGRDSRVAPAGVMASLLALGVVGASWVTGVEPAYTTERPERRVIRYVQDMVQREAFWEVGAHERGATPAGADASAPRDWQPADTPPAVSLRLGAVSGPFRYRAKGRGLVAPPLDVSSVIRPVIGTPEGWLETTAVPLLEGTGVVFALPPGVTPLESNLNGVVIDGRWRVTVIPAPATGATLRVRLSEDGMARLADGRIRAVTYGVPGGVGWQRLPRWLPQETIVWTARSYFVLAWPVPTQGEPEQ